MRTAPASREAVLVHYIGDTSTRGNLIAREQSRVRVVLRTLYIRLLAAGKERGFATSAFHPPRMSRARSAKKRKVCLTVCIWVCYGAYRMHDSVCYGVYRSVDPLSQRGQAQLNPGHFREQGHPFLPIEQANPFFICE